MAKGQTASGDAADPSCPVISDQQAAHVERRCRWAVVVLSFGFLGVFSGFQAAQGLQSSLNATLGDINLACLYGTFTLLCLAAPPLIAGLERCIGMRVLLLLCSLAYVAMVVSNVIETPADPAPVWAVPISMNVLVGIAAPLLWTVQNAYVCRCATRAALARAENESEVERWTSQMSTRFNSLFFTIYQFSGLLGNVLASVLLTALGDAKNTKKFLFLTLGGTSTLGAAVFLTLPPMAETAAASRPPSLLDTARLALSDAKTALMIPLMVTNGMTLASFLGDFQTDVTCPLAGSQFTGFVVATFFGVNSLASQGWGRAITAGCVSRRTAYIAATLCIAAFLIVKLFWSVPQNFKFDETSSTKWSRQHNTEGWQYATALGLATLFACGDAFYEAGPPMTLQTFYSGTAQVVPAMANYKLWQSLGFAVQFPLAVVLKTMPEVRNLILLALLGVSVLCLLLLDCFVARVDPPPATGEPVAASSSA